MMLSNHHRAKSCFFHLGYDTRKIESTMPTNERTKHTAKTMAAIDRGCRFAGGK
jgi:hypothetical protein